MHRPPLSLRVAFAVSCLLAIAACGQFFPSSTSITALAVAPLNATVAPGVTQQYTATATYGNNSTGDVTSSVTWSTSQSSVATISSSGLLSGVALGTAIVKAQSGSVTSSTNISVANKTVSSLVISPATPPSLSLSTAPTLQFTATATYSDGSQGIVTSTCTWTSSAPSIVSIATAGSASPGLATALATGTASISATASGVTSSNSATVLVNP